MAFYNVKIGVTGNNIATVRKQMAKAFPGQEIEVDKVNMNPSRADRLNAAISQIEDAKSEIENLRDELQEWRDSLPENLQNGDKANQLDDAISELESVISELDNVDGMSVEFPSMMG